MSYRPSVASRNPSRMSNCCSGSAVTAHFSTLWTAGGIISTSGDMARWVQGLHEGAVISPSSLTQMVNFIPTTTAPVTGFGWYGYGLGIRQGAYYTQPVRGHTGSIMGYISITGYLPRTGASVVVLFNACLLYTSPSPRD